MNENILREILQPTETVDVSDATVRVLLRAEQHHQYIRDQLQQICTAGDMGHDIVMGDGGPKLKHETELYKGLVLGVRLALHIIGDFPLKFEEVQGE